MAISRRNFLLGTSAGLILPSFYEKAFSYLANHGEPLLPSTGGLGETLYAVKDNGRFELMLGATEIELPVIPLKEYVLDHLSYASLEDYAEEYRGEEPTEALMQSIDWDEPIDPENAYECLGPFRTPNGEAYLLLQYLDLGPELEGRSPVGQLTFHAGDSPCNDYHGVHAKDEITLSLLQQRLNELGKNVQIQLA